MNCLKCGKKLGVQKTEYITKNMKKRFYRCDCEDLVYTTFEILQEPVKVYRKNSYKRVIGNP